MRIVQRLPDGSEPPPAPLVLADPDRVGTVAAELVLNRLWARPHARHAPADRPVAADDVRGPARARPGRAPPARAPPPSCSSTSTRAWVPATRAASRRSCARSWTASRSARSARIDGAAPDLAAEAARHAAVLEEAPIDLAVLGLGRDGHVAFDEPPARMASGVAVVSLAGMTREDAAPAFGGAEHVPARALTTGLGTLYRARELILLVSGAAKAPALRAMLEDPVDRALARPRCCATIPA